MKKLTLVCMIDRISLSDFGVVLAKGDKLEVTEDDIKRSSEVRRALHLGGLVYHSAKKHPRMRDTSRRGVVKKQRKSAKKPVHTTTLEERLRGMIAEALNNNLGEIVSAIDATRAENTQKESLTAEAVDADTIRAIMNEVVSKMPKQQVVVQGGGQAPTAVQADDTPMFIPTGIVSSELEAEIDTASESSKGSSVDAATEALRQLRKAKKKKES